jgi:hypothetical protein
VLERGIMLKMIEIKHLKIEGKMGYDIKIRKKYATIQNLLENLNRFIEQIVQGSYPPWSRIPSVEEMAAEVGIDGAEFLHSLGSGLDLEQLAEKFDVSPKTIEHLYDHFMHYGVGSIMGGD